MHVVKEADDMLERIRSLNKTVCQIDEKLDKNNDKLDSIINITENTREEIKVIDKEIKNRMIDVLSMTNNIKGQLLNQKRIIYVGAIIIAMFILFTIRYI